MAQVMCSFATSGTGSEVAPLHPLAIAQAEKIPSTGETLIFGAQ
jgi:hypothetical protein